MKEKRNLILGGLVIGVIAAALALLGNPANMGFCIACFLRDIAGALGLHAAAPVQYARPEIPGLVLGACAAALIGREFKPRGGSAPVTRFIIGALVMIGGLVFLGCPFRMILRLAGGDMNALLGLLGFAAGIAAGVLLLKSGFSLGRAQPQRRLEGLALPAGNLILLAVMIFSPGVLAASEAGPGSMHAALGWSLAAGLLVGAIAQRTRLCMAGGIRDALLFGDFTLLMGFAAVLVGALAVNLLAGRFTPGFAGQPVAHTDGLWNFLGMTVVGLGSVMLGGCPLRQLVLSGEGSSDGAMAVLGMVFGAALSHNFGLASSAEGATAGGKGAAAAGLVILLALGAYYTLTGRKKHENA